MPITSVSVTTGARHVFCRTTQKPGSCQDAVEVSKGKAGAAEPPGRKSLLRDDVLGLWAFLAVCDRELDFLAVG